jgi:hypothetical protein
MAPDARGLAGSDLEDFDAACRRFDEAIRAAFSRGEDASVVYPGLYGVLRTPKEVVDDVLTIEGELLAQ